jgi:hypothetical protein
MTHKATAMNTRTWRGLICIRLVPAAVDRRRGFSLLYIAFWHQSQNEHSTSLANGAVYRYLNVALSVYRELIAEMRPRQTSTVGSVTWTRNILGENMSLPALARKPRRKTSPSVSPSPDDNMSILQSPIASSAQTRPQTAQPDA